METKVSRKQKFRDDAMNEARHFFVFKNIAYEQVDDWTFKIGDINYWPHKQKLFRDGDSKSIRNVDLNKLARILSEGTLEICEIQIVPFPEPSTSNRLLKNYLDGGFRS